jgi:DNA modification methylase
MKDNIEQEIEMRSTKELIPYVRNTRTHSEEQVGQIAASIKEFGFTNPVLVDQDNMIIAGHGRVMAANKLDLKEVPTIRLDYLTEAQKRAYVIADNRLALNADWDYEMLKVELKELDDLEFDVNLLGFEDKEINDLLAEPTEGLVDEDEVPDLPDEPVTKLGDLWQLGNHRLLCGDSTSIDAVDALMDGNKADMVFTDPPYGINYQDLQKNHKKIENDESLSNIKELLSITLGFDCPLYICCNWKCFSTFEECMNEYGKYPKSCIIWDKKVRVQNLDKFFKQHEFILYYGEFGGQETLDGDVWQCSREVRKDHPTAKPVELCERAIRYSSDINSIVLDLFLGSGSTLIAAEKTNRKCYGMELDPKYCDVIINRWQDFTGKEAVHLELNKTYNKLNEHEND